MFILCGKVTGLKRGQANEKGKIFHTLRVEVGDKTYYPLFEDGLLNPQKDQEVTLACNVSARMYDGKSQLSIFVAGHVADEMIIDPENYRSLVTTFNDF